MIDVGFWRRYFRVYDALNHLPTYKQLLLDVSEEAGAKDGELVLDAGSGTGNLAVRIAESGGRVIALDYCPEALDRHRNKDGRGNLILADLSRGLPFTDGSFDKIASTNALYALSADDQRATVREFHRVLKSGGKIVLANPRKGQRAPSMVLNVIADNVRGDGLCITVKKMLALLPDMIRMAYYNWRLRMESQHHRFEGDEQRILLEHVGFHSVSETKVVYSGQAVLNSAYK